MSDAHSGPDARSDWERRIGRRSVANTEAWNEGPDAAIAAPANLRAEAGAGHVTLTWELVKGAMGYLVLRSESPEGPFEPVDHGGRDVLAVPGPRYADTTGLPGQTYWYAVASLNAAEAPPGYVSSPVEACSTTQAPEPINLRVDAGSVVALRHPVWHMAGSERLSQLCHGKGPGGRPVGEEFEAALRMAHDELGVDRIRAHAIFHDDLEVYQEVSGEPRYDFTKICDIYDRILKLGIRPVVELSFMPRDLATNPGATIFEYKGIISPPKDWARWGELNRRLAEHLVNRYGVDEVSRWGFEVWNEANLEVFWTGSQAEYFRLYDVAARAIKQVDDRLMVGGPATAAAEWIPAFLDFVRREGSPLDFVSTHTYGNMPLEVRAPLVTRGLGYVEVWWTEWGATPTHFALVNDSAFGAPFVLHGMKSVQGRADALGYWVVSDHFEELGRASRLFHGGFGLLTIGNLRKPRYWALALSEQLGPDLLQAELHGDGGGSLVDAWASRKSDGSIDILAWNGTIDQSKADGDALLARRLRVCIEQVEGRTYKGTLALVDTEHSNIVRRWSSETDWPTLDDWARLRQADRLYERALPDIKVSDGVIDLDIDLPMPSVIRLRLTPA